LFVVNERILIIKEIIETTRRRDATRREKRHSIVVVERTRVEFVIEYIQSIAIDT